MSGLKVDVTQGVMRVLDKDVLLTLNRIESLLVIISVLLLVMIALFLFGIGGTK